MPRALGLRKRTRLEVELLENRLVPSVSAPDHLYTFTSSLDDQQGGPALVSEGGVLGGGRYSFAANQALTLQGALADPSTYSIAMELELDSLSPFFKKLVDFSNRTSDNGLYISGASVQLYPGWSGTASVTDNTDFQVVLTRDGATGDVSLYLNGVLQQTYTGFTSSTAVADGNVLTFFADDRETSFFEAVGGSVDFIAIYNRVLSAADAAELAAGMTTVSAAEIAVSVDEGGVASNSGTWSDANFDPVTLSASAGTIVQNADGTWSWSFNTQDGPAESQTVTITATAAEGAMATTSFELVVNNVAPTLSASIVTNAKGEATLTGNFVDPGLLDTHTVTINWGDGSAPTTLDAATNSFVAAHQYSGGVFVVTVTVTDSNGASASTTLSATVTGIGLIDGTLYVVGTSAKDVIRVTSHKSGRGQEVVYTVTAIFNLGTGRPRMQVQTFRADEVKDIVVLGSGGNDHVFLPASLASKPGKP